MNTLDDEIFCIELQRKGWKTELNDVDWIHRMFFTYFFLLHQNDEYSGLTNSVESSNFIFCCWNFCCRFSISFDAQLRTTYIYKMFKYIEFATLKAIDISSILTLTAYTLYSRIRCELFNGCANSIRCNAIECNFKKKEERRKKNTKNKC